MLIPQVVSHCYDLGTLEKQNKTKTSGFKIQQYQALNPVSTSGFLRLTKYVTFRLPLSSRHAHFAQRLSVRFLS